MQRTLAFAIALAAIAPFAASRASDAYPINPGYWEAKTVYLGLISATDRWCIKPKDIAKFLSGPSNHIYHCTYPINHAGDGMVRFEGSCVDKKGQEIKLSGQGEYTPTTLHMHAIGSGEFLGLPITGDALADAHFISDDCPPDAKAFQ